MVAVSLLPVSFLLSFLLVSAAGAVTSSAGLVSAGFSVVFGSFALGASVLAAPRTDAVVSSLKSPMAGVVRECEAVPLEGGDSRAWTVRLSTDAPGYAGTAESAVAVEGGAVRLPAWTAAVLVRGR